MRRKRTILMLVAVMLLCAMAVSAVAANLAEPAALKKLAVMDMEGLPERPEVTAVGNLVTNDGGKTHTGYFELSLRVSAKAFQSAGVVLTYDSTVLHPVDWQSTGKRVELEKRNSWDTAAVAHTKGADGLSGKPALTYAEYTTVDGEAVATGKAYLYLGADALEYTPLDNELVVTVRFEVEKGEDGSLLAIDMPEAGVSRPSYTVELTKAAGVLNGSVPGVSLMTSAGPGEDSSSQEPVFYTSADDPDYTVTFVREDGPSINKGGSVVSGDYAITFFDWDGRVIDAIAAPEDAADVVASWEQHTAIQARLGNKPGYEFDRWLVVYEDNDGEGLHTAGGTFTSNDAALAAGNPDVADLSNISGYVSPKDPDSKSVLLQACYKATADINNGNPDGVATDKNHPDARYKLVEQSYYQYGSTDGAASGQYAVRCKVQRESVLRAEQPVVMALVYLSSGEYLTERVDLENTDNTEFEIVVPRGTASVAYQVLDISGQTNWTLSVSRSEELRPNQATILREGAFALIVDEARTGTLTTGGSSVNLACFKDSGLTGVNAGNMSAKKQALATATAAKNTGKPQNEWVPLTRAEAQAAIGA